MENEVKGFYFFNLDVGERCEINFADKLPLECIILQYYKDERNIYLIVASRIEKECFIIGYNYNKTKVFYSEKCSSYKDARIAFIDIMKAVV